MAEIIVKSHVGDVKKELEHRIPTILEALGLQAEGNAVKEITDMKAVDTGRLKNSISHTKTEDSAIIGTNVEYAPYVELGTHKMASRPFLRNGLSKYTEDYKRILKEGLK